MSTWSKGSLEKACGCPEDRWSRCGHAGIWKLRWSAGFRPDGSRRQFKATVKGTKAEAERKLRDALKAVDDGQFVDPSKLTVESYLTEWLESRGGSLKPSTWSGYHAYLSAYVFPTLGEKRLQLLSSADLDKVYADLLTRQRKPLKPRSVRLLHSIISRSLKDAVKRDPQLIKSNVADSCRNVPSPKAARAPEMKTWTAEQVRTFLGHVREDPLYPAWALLIGTGARRGEVLGARWQDVSADGASLSIRQNIVLVDHRPTVGTPKTGKARVVDLDENVQHALKSWRLAQGRPETGLMFRGVHPQAFSRAFDTHVKAAGLPRIRVHDVRHTRATLMLIAGVLAKVVADQLGHSSIVITIDLYSHVMPGMGAEAARTVAALYSSPAVEGVRADL